MLGDTTTIGGAGDVLSLGTRLSDGAGTEEAIVPFFCSEDEEEDADGLEPARPESAEIAGLSFDVAAGFGWEGGFALLGGGGGGADCLSGGLLLFFDEVKLREICF